MAGRRARVTSDITEDIPEPGEYWSSNHGTGKVLVTEVIGSKTFYAADTAGGNSGAMPTRMFRYYYSKVVTNK
jgi:hypothetical protein